MPQEPYSPFADALELADVAQHIKDPQAATIAYTLLFIQAVEGDIDVYARPVRGADGRLRFNVWDNHRETRTSLEEWCAAWYADYQQRKGGRA